MTVHRFGRQQSSRRRERLADGLAGSVHGEDMDELGRVVAINGTNRFERRRARSGCLITGERDAGDLDVLTWRKRRRIHPCGIGKEDMAIIIPPTFKQAGKFGKVFFEPTRHVRFLRRGTCRERSASNSDHQSLLQHLSVLSLKQRADRWIRPFWYLCFQAGTP